VASLVSEVRAALGKEGRAWLRTVHGVGYAFAGETTEVSAATTCAAFVLIEKGPPPRTLPLSDGVTVIGRGAKCTLRVSSTTVSRAHAQICLQRGAAILEDLGSMNGTYLRGNRLTAPAPLLDGDEIRVGSVDLVFRSADPERATEPMA
jgi:hypothetical protein